MPKLPGYTYWGLQRKHVLGDLTLAEFVIGLPDPLPEYFSCCEVDGDKIHVPAWPEEDNEPSVREKRPVTLPSGAQFTLVQHGTPVIQQFLRHWVSKVGIPKYGDKIGTLPEWGQAGAALLTNYHLWEMAVKYLTKTASPK